MSSNVYKANFIQFSQENTKVIDANSLVAKRLEGFSGVYRESAPEETSGEGEEGFETLDPLQMAELLADRDGVLPEEETEPAELTPEEVRAQLDEMKRNAEAEIEEAKASARDEIEALKKEAAEEAKSEGYEEGKALAEKEYFDRLSELDEKEKALEDEYEALANELEGKIVDAVTGIYKKVFGDNFYNNREVILTLISKALFHVGNEDGIIIHVSPADYELVDESRERLFEGENYGKEPEIKVEERLSHGQIKVETAYGLIDCSLDTELKELSRTLHMLSYEGSGS